MPTKLENSPGHPQFYVDHHVWLRHPVNSDCGIYPETAKQASRLLRLGYVPSDDSGHWEPPQFPYKGRLQCA